MFCLSLFVSFTILPFLPMPIFSLPFHPAFYPPTSRTTHLLLTNHSTYLLALLPTYISLYPSNFFFNLLGFFQLAYFLHPRTYLCMHLFIFVLSHISTHLPIFLPAYLTFTQLLYRPFHPCTYLPFYPSIYLPFSPTNFLPILYLSINLPICRARFSL